MMSRISFKKNKVFIIGAGFSKGLANAPVTDEFFTKMYLKAKEERDIAKHAHKQHIESFLKLIHYLQKQTYPLMDRLQSNGKRIKRISEDPIIYPMNAEFLCTIIDLNIERAFIPRGIGVDLRGCPVPYLKGFYPHDLEEARTFIIHNILELFLPHKLDIDWERLDKFTKRIEPEDTIITFNYDILMEQALWRRKLWHPIDGYGIGEIAENETLIQKPEWKTKVLVYKLHGSINWLRPGMLDSEEKVSIIAGNPYNQSPFFEGLEIEGRYDITYSETLINRHALFPTFMKTFEKRWELKLFHAAEAAIEKADVVYFLGYSLPQADAMANLIVSKIRPDAQAVIVNPHIQDDMTDRLKQICGLKQKNLFTEESKMEDWIDNDFEFLEYQKVLNQENQIEKFIQFSEKRGTNNVRNSRDE